MFRTVSEYAEAAGVSTDLDITHLISAETRSIENVDNMSKFIAQKLSGNQGIDIVAFGSLARNEWTDQSDFDYLVVVHEITPARELRDALKVAERARGKLEASEPGASGMFGVIVSATELIARIGLETDTNQTLTRRLLMLEESVSLYNKVAHKNFLKSMLDRYLVEYEGHQKKGIPRFLLNDVVRHWRTVAVDYQAKNWQRVTDEGWGLRYLKLKISRKLAFAGTLAPLLSIGIEDDTPTADQVLDEAGQEALFNALKIAGNFNRSLNSSDFRKEASDVAGKEDEGQSFRDALQDAKDLQTHLNKIFMGVDSPLKPLSEEYLVF